MLSYRHSYHAGNHGDVLKHVCQMLIIEKLKTKEKGFSYFDSHSGRGIYQLNSDESSKTNEYLQGIERLYEHELHNQSLVNYLSLVKRYQPFSQYPGSPEIAKSLCRVQDNLVLMELHNQEISALRSNIGGKNIAIHHRDGYEGLNALTPPQLKRGLILIDPSYEQASEYQIVEQTVFEIYKKWSSAIFAIWYPLISDRKSPNTEFSSSSSKQGKSQQMLEELVGHPFKNLLNIELRVTQEHESEGMYGSGMAIINAPWQLDKQIKEALTELTPLLGQSSNADYTVEWLIQDD